MTPPWKFKVVEADTLEELAEKLGELECLSLTVVYVGNKKRITAVNIPQYPIPYYEALVMVIETLDDLLRKEEGMTRYRFETEGTT